MRVLYVRVSAVGQQLGGMLGRPVRTHLNACAKPFGFGLCGWAGRGIFLWVVVGQPFINMLFSPWQFPRPLPASSQPVAGQVSANSKPAPGQLLANPQPAPGQLPDAPSQFQLAPSPASSWPAPSQLCSSCRSAAAQRPASSWPRGGQEGKLMNTQTSSDFVAVDFLLIFFVGFLFFKC